MVLVGIAMGLRSVRSGYCLTCFRLWAVPRTAALAHSWSYIGRLNGHGRGFGVAASPTSREFSSAPNSFSAFDTNVFGLRSPDRADIQAGPRSLWPGFIAALGIVAIGLAQHSCAARLTWPRLDRGERPQGINHAVAVARETINELHAIVKGNFRLCLICGG